MYGCLGALVQLIYLSREKGRERGGLISAHMYTYVRISRIYGLYIYMYIYTHTHTHTHTHTRARAHTLIYIYTYM